MWRAPYRPPARDPPFRPRSQWSSSLSSGQTASPPRPRPRRPHVPAEHPQGPHRPAETGRDRRRCRGRLVLRLCERDAFGHLVTCCRSQSGLFRIGPGHGSRRVDPVAGFQILDPLADSFDYPCRIRSGRVGQFRLRSVGTRSYICFYGVDPDGVYFHEHLARTRPQICHFFYLQNLRPAELLNPDGSHKHPFRPAYCRICFQARREISTSILLARHRVKQAKRGARGEARRNPVMERNLLITVRLNWLTKGQGHLVEEIETAVRRDLPDRVCSRRGQSTSMLPAPPSPLEVERCAW